MEVTKRFFKGLFVLFLVLISMQEGMAQSSMDAILKQAREAMNRGDYQAANIKFREMLSLNEVVPNDALYFFAVTLDRVHQLQSSKNFLEKYLSVTGKSGDYYNEAKILESRLEKELVDILACEYCDDNGYRLTICGLCKGKGHVDTDCPLCHGYGEITCSKCLGEGVQILKADFGDDHYKTCDECKGTGKVQCTRCLGEKHVDQECPECGGSGRKGSQQLCDHKQGFLVPNIDKLDNR